MGPTITWRVGRRTPTFTGWWDAAVPLSARFSALISMPLPFQWMFLLAS